MKKNIMTTVAALAIAAALQTVAKAEDPISPVQGAVCNLYLVDVPDSRDPKNFIELSSSLAQQPAVATFADTASDFNCKDKLEGIASNAGMWTGWLKVEKAGTYTFLCKRYAPDEGYEGARRYRYSIWINGKKCIEAALGQNAFNVDLEAGFNAVKIIAGSGRVYPLSITYKKAGALKEPEPFGPGDMFHDDEE
ncbi:MAG: hypothetical protein J6Y19_03985 [Kiritimatiellae bacterium]|nr:hypothetical protein [Kiritimatiellia bacterium]